MHFLINANEASSPDWSPQRFSTADADQTQFLQSFCAESKSHTYGFRLNRRQFMALLLFLKNPVRILTKGFLTTETLYLEKGVCHPLWAGKHMSKGTAKVTGRLKPSKPVNSVSAYIPGGPKK